MENSPDSNNANPFQPPQHILPKSQVEFAGDIGTIVSKFKFTQAFLIESINRFRSQRKAFRLLGCLRYCWAGLLFLGGCLGLLTQQYVYAVFIIAIAAFFVLPRFLLENLILLRRLKNHPLCDKSQTLSFSESGIKGESEVEKTDLKWAVFTRAVLFHDGVLLYRGASDINWIPDRTLQTADGPQRLRKLVSQKLPTTNAK